MTGGSSLDQAQSKAVIGLLQHMEGLSIAQITQDIHSQVIAPITHDPWRRPALLLITPILHANLLTKSPNILQDIPLNAPHGTITKRLTEDSPLPCMQRLIPGVMRIGHGVGKGIVELGLADVGAEAVDVLEGGAGVEGDGVGAEAHHGAVLLVQTPELEMAVAAVGVVELVGVGELGEDGAGVFGEGVEEDAVDGEGEELVGLLVLFSSAGGKTHVDEARAQEGGC